MIPDRSLDRDIKLFISALCLQFRPLRVDSNIPECDCTDRSFSVNTVVIVGLPLPLHDQWPSGQLQSSLFVK